MSQSPHSVTFKPLVSLASPFKRPLLKMGFRAYCDIQRTPIVFFPSHRLDAAPSPAFLISQNFPSVAFGLLMFRAGGYTHGTKQPAIAHHRRIIEGLEDRQGPQRTRLGTSGHDLPPWPPRIGSRS